MGHYDERETERQHEMLMEQQRRQMAYTMKNLPKEAQEELVRQLVRSPMKSESRKKMERRVDARANEVDLRRRWTFEGREWWAMDPQPEHLRRGDRYVSDAIDSGHLALASAQDEEYRIRMGGCWGRIVLTPVPEHDPDTPTMWGFDGGEWRMVSGYPGVALAESFPGFARWLPVEGRAGDLVKRYGRALVGWRFRHPSRERDTFRIRAVSTAPGRAWDTECSRNTGSHGFVHLIAPPMTTHSDAAIATGLAAVNQMATGRRAEVNRAIARDADRLKAIEQNFEAAIDRSLEKHMPAVADFYRSDAPAACAADKSGHVCCLADGHSGNHWNPIAGEWLQIKKKSAIKRACKECGVELAALAGGVVRAYCVYCYNNAHAPREQGEGIAPIVLAEHHETERYERPGRETPLDDPNGLDVACDGASAASKWGDQ